MAADAMFNPRSLALVGASSDLAKFAGKVTANALRSTERSPRPVYLVNPNRPDVLGHKTYPTIGDVPETVDHAYIAVRASAVPDQLRAADDAGVRLATVFASGFSESAPGTDHIDLTEVLQPLRIRAIGPNCNGVINVFDSLAVTSSSVPYMDLMPGPIAIISHSGALGQVNGLQRACSRGIGVGLQMSCGNATDVTEVDLIEQAFADPRITVVVGILERISHGTRLLEVVETAREAGKLLVLVKLGQSTAGRSAIMGHTGDALGDDGIARRLLKDAGVVLLEDIDQALDCADLWAKHPRLVTNRIASVSLSGGNLAYFVDACAIRGIAHPALPAETQDALRAILPPLAVVSNPVDLSSSSDVIRSEQAEVQVDSMLPAVLSLLDASRQDAKVAILTLAPDSDLKALMSLDLSSHATPTIVIWAGDSREGRTSIKDLRVAGLTVFQSAVSCAEALQNFRGDREGVVDAPSAPDRVWPLTRARSRLLEAGMTFPAGQFAATEDEASAAAAQLGYPVAVKSAAAGLVHKAAMGGVMLTLGSDAEVRAAYRSVVQAVELHGFREAERVLVEVMTDADDALFMSVVRDESFGPVVVLGQVQNADSHGPGVAVAALDALHDDELAQLVRSTLGDVGTEALEAIQQTIESARTVATSDGVELVEVNPLFILGSAACAVDCVVIGAHTDD